jgi:hypothetical protein
MSAINTFFRSFSCSGMLDSCWEWTGALTSKGYGEIIYKRKNWLAHRFSYEYFIGPIPEGLNVLHKCDNPKCVNWHHLVAGTQQENIQDMIGKGRENLLFLKKGEKSPNSKLTQAQVDEIRMDYIPNVVTVKALSIKYGVTAGAIWQVLARITWK